MAMAARGAEPASSQASKAWPMLLSSRPCSSSCIFCGVSNAPQHRQMADKVQCPVPPWLELQALTGCT